MKTTTGSGFCGLSRKNGMQFIRSIRVYDKSLTLYMHEDLPVSGIPQLNRNNIKPSENNNKKRTLNLPRVKQLITGNSTHSIC